MFHWFRWFDLLIFKEILLEVIELLAFCWDLLFSRTCKIEIRGYLISGNMSVLLKHSNWQRGEDSWMNNKKKIKSPPCWLTSVVGWMKRIKSAPCRLTSMISGSSYWILVQIITKRSVGETVVGSGVLRGLIKYINMRCDLLFGNS